MRTLCSRLDKRGYPARAFSYRTLLDDTERNIATLTRYVAQIDAKHLHLVAHSLGGLLCWRYLQGAHDERVRTLVMLGSPIRGSAVARRLAASPAGKLLLGRARDTLESGVPLTLPTGVRVGVIAGNLGVGLGRGILRMSAPHDGTVQLTETQVERANDSLTLPVSHTGLIFSSTVAEQVVHFLDTGRFRHVASMR